MKKNLISLLTPLLVILTAAPPAFAVSPGFSAGSAAAALRPTQTPVDDADTDQPQAILIRGGGGSRDRDRGGSTRQSAPAPAPAPQRAASVPDRPSRQERAPEPTRMDSPRDDSRRESRRQDRQDTSDRSQGQAGTQRSPAPQDPVKPADSGFFSRFGLGRRDRDTSAGSNAPPNTPIPNSGSGRRLSKSNLFSDDPSTGVRQPRVRREDVTKMARGQKLGQVDESTRQVTKHKNDDGETHRVQTDHGQTITESFRPDGKRQYSDVRDRSGKLLGQTYYRADGVTPAYTVSKHRDGRGQSIIKKDESGNTITMSTRRLKDGREATSTSIMHADGSREVQHANGSHESWIKDRYSGRPILMAKTERLSGGLTREMRRENNSTGYTVYHNYSDGRQYNYHYNTTDMPGFVVYTPIYHPYYAYDYYYTPFYAPIPYADMNWGWSWYTPASPYYGWFQPYSVYRDPYLWLTDYLIADMIDSRYRRTTLVDQQTQADQQQQIQNLQGEVSQQSAQLSDEELRNQKLEQEVQDQQSQLDAQKGRIDEQVKAQVAQQVQATMQTLRQNTAQRTDEQTPGAPVLVLSAVANLPQAQFDRKHIFAIHQELTETVAEKRTDKDENGDPKTVYFIPEGADVDTCQLSEGDLVRIVQIDADNNKFAYANVVSAVADSSDPCAAGSVVGISGPVLQEMLNEFVVHVQTGMDEMQKKADLKAKLEASH